MSHTIGIVGTGRIVQQAYLMILPLIDGLEGVVLYDVDASKAESACDVYDYWLRERRFALEHDKRLENAQARAATLRPKIVVSKSLEDVLSRADSVIVTTPPSSHLEVAQACLDSGCAALIEKPLAVSSHTAKEFADRNSMLLHRVRYLENYPHNPAFRKVRQIVCEGSLGAPLLISVCLNKRMPTDPADIWRTDPHISGGGVLSDWGSHTYGLALFLSGDNGKVIALKQETMQFVPYTHPPVEKYALVSVFTETASKRPLTLLVENSWEAGKPGMGSSGFWASVMLTGGSITVEQQLLGESKQYLIRSAKKHEESAVNLVPQEFTHDSFYYSLAECLLPNPSPYTSFDFGQQIVDLVERSRISS